MIKKGIPVQLRAEFQENSYAACDTGSSVSIMKEEWPQFDWSTVDPIFPAKTGLYTYSVEGVAQRGLEVRTWLKNRPEKVVAVVSHAGFLRVGLTKKRYANADFRIFDFADGEDEAARLVEWELTEKNGGGLGKSEKPEVGVEV